MTKTLAKQYAHARGGIIGRGSGVSQLKLSRLRGVGVSPLKKTSSIYFGVKFGMSHEKTIYYEDVLNKRLVESKYKLYNEVYYIDKMVTKITH